MLIDVWDAIAGQRGQASFVDRIAIQQITEHENTV
jgi:hypothetical protein